MKKIVLFMFLVLGFLSSAEAAVASGTCSASKYSIVINQIYQGGNGNPNYIELYANEDVSNLNNWTLQVASGNKIEDTFTVSDGIRNTSNEAVGNSVTRGTFILFNVAHNFIPNNNGEFLLKNGSGEVIHYLRYNVVNQQNLYWDPPTGDCTTHVVLDNGINSGNNSGICSKPDGDNPTNGAWQNDNCEDSQGYSNMGGKCELVFANGIGTTNKGSVWLDGKLYSDGNRVIPTPTLGGNALGNGCDNAQCLKGDPAISLPMPTNNSNTSQSGTLSVNTGQDYYFQQYQNFNGSDTITVNGNGTARIHIKQGGFIINGKINEGGDPSKLIIFINGDVNINASAIVNAILYVNGTVHVNTPIKGAITASGEVRVNSDGSVTYDGVANADFGDFCIQTSAPTPTPIADYRFDECYWSSADDEVKDSSGNNLHAKAYNGADTTKDGKICRGGSFNNDIAETNSLNELLAMLKEIIEAIICWIQNIFGGSCDGITDAVVYADDNDMLDITSAITVMGWVATKDDDGIFLSKYEETGLLSTTKKGYSLGLVNNKLQWTTDSDTLSSTTDIPQNQWVHIAVTYDGSTKKIYIDGVERGSNSYSGGISATDVGLMLGYINGYMDEVKIFNSALSNEEINNIITLENNGKNIDGSTRVCNPACDDNGPTIHYSFEDCTVGETVTNVIDSSGGENHGTGYPSTNGGLQCVNTYCGKGVTFDGVNDYIKSNDNFSFTYEEGFTVISTFKFNWTTYRSWLLFFGMNDPGADGCSNNGMHWLINTRSKGDCGELGKGMIQFGPFCGSQNRYNIFTPTDYEDIFVTMATVYDKSTKKLTTYLNGVVISEETSNDPVSGNAPVFIGKTWSKCSNDSYFKGVMDDLKIFNRTLSRDDIISYTCSEPRGSFRFDVCEQNQQNKIYTKVAGQDFNLKISSIDIDTDTETAFTGTVCLRKVDMISNTQTAWEPFVFNNLASQLITENISTASRNLRYDIAWDQKDTPDSNCVFADTTASKAWSDSFAVKPSSFEWSWSNDDIPIKAGIAESVTLASTYAANGQGYNGSATITSGGNVLIDSSLEECEINSTTPTIVATPSNATFTDGNQSNSVEVNTTVSEVGIWDVNISMKDSDWTAIDKPFDCIADSNLSTPDIDGKVGCDIGNSKSLRFKVYPENFGITVNKLSQTSQSSNGETFLYYGQGIDNDFNSNYVEQNITIKARNNDNNLTKNYDPKCFAPKDTELKIDLNLTNKKSYPLLLRYEFDDDPEGNGDVEKGTISIGNNDSFTINAIDSNGTYSKGESNNTLKLSLDIDRSAWSLTNGGRSTPINPIKFIGGDNNDSNITIVANLENDGIKVEGVSEGEPFMEQNLTYYFARLVPIDVKTTDDNADVRFYIDVFCDSNCGTYNLNAKSKVYPSNWYVNTLDDSAKNISFDVNDINITSPTSIEYNPTTKSFTALFTKNDNNFYGRARIDINHNDNNNTHLYYNPYSDNNVTRFYIDFLQPDSDATSSDVVKNEGANTRGSKRIDW